MNCNYCKHLEWCSVDDTCLCNALDRHDNIIYFDDYCGNITNPRIVIKDPDKFYCSFYEVDK